MLNLEHIKSYYPEQYRGFERFMLREYLQYKILEIIYESRYAGKLIFMGGTALRIIYNNNRFSEDLDFDNFNIAVTDFELITEIIRKNLVLQGFDVEIKNVYKGAYHCQIRFPGLLKEMEISGHSGEKILIRIDTEPQNFTYKPNLKLVNKFDVFTEIITIPEDIILAQKFYAVINRPRNKGRDFYDIVFLLGRNVKPNYDFLKFKTGISDAHQLLDRLEKKLSQINMNVMAKDVAPFLMNPNDIKKVIRFRDYLKSVEL